VAAVRRLIPPQPGPRVNPFLLPSATAARFLLLMVLTLLSSTFAADWYMGGSDNWDNDYDACVRMVDAISHSG
jgi:hypothetical protein